MSLITLTIRQLQPPEPQGGGLTFAQLQAVWRVSAPTARKRIADGKASVVGRLTYFDRANAVRSTPLYQLEKSDEPVRN